MFFNGMANKTDSQYVGKRCRIRFACDPALGMLFDYLNIFPPIENMDFSAEVPLFRSFTATGKSITPMLQKKKFEWQFSLYIAGLNLLDDLWEKAGYPAVYKLAPPEVFDRVRDLKNEWANAVTDCQNMKEYLTLISDAEYNSKIDRLEKSKHKFHDFIADTARHWFRNYYRIRKLKTLLVRLAFVGRNFDVAERTLDIDEIVDIDHLIPVLGIDAQGNFTVGIDPALKSLEGIDVKRIRQCKICRNLFWASRSDKQCCQKKCANTYNQRLSRERKETYGPLYKQAARTKTRRN